MKAWLTLLLFMPHLLAAQFGCPGSFTPYFLDANHIKAAFFPRGNKFIADSTGGFYYSFPGQAHVSMINASSPWIGGFDDAENFKASFELNPLHEIGNYGVGPLTSIGTPYPDSVCSHFDRVWTVNGEDIHRHFNDFYDDFKLQDTIPSIFGWPAAGNKYFRRFNGFDLPPDNGPYYAPFSDTNGNGKYDPDQGDFPIPFPSRSELIIPDQMMWMVFNNITGSSIPPGIRPMRFEFQLLAYVFYCQDNEVLNNTVFNRYTLISRAVTPIDSVFFGLWTDFNVGCPSDDFIGCDSLFNTSFAYNADEMDGDTGFICSHGVSGFENQVPPLVSMTWLSEPMYSCIAPYTIAQETFSQYRLLNGQWSDGTDIRPQGDGYDEDPGLPSTRYLFSGDLRDTASWSAKNVLESGYDVQSLSAVSMGRFNPGVYKMVDLAYTLHYDPNADYTGQIQAMYEDIAWLNEGHWWSFPCAQFKVCLDGDCVWPGDFDHNGRVDHEDYLAWGVLYGQVGARRNGLIAWRGFFGEDWSSAFNEINGKHADGNGDGQVNDLDLEIHRTHNLKINPDYVPSSEYPEGHTLIVSAEDGYMDGINQLRISSGRRIDNILGMAFEIEFDTSVFQINSISPHWPDTIQSVSYPDTQQMVHYYPYAHVQTHTAAIDIPANFTLIDGLSPGLTIREGKVPPDSTVIRLKNLKAVDAHGAYLPIGSETLVLYKAGHVQNPVPHALSTKVFPNPSHDVLNVQVPVTTDLDIYFIQGTRVRHLKDVQPQVVTEITNLQSGMYILRIAATGESIKLAVQ